MTILVQELKAENAAFRAEIDRLTVEIASLKEHRQFLDGLRETFGYDSWTTVVGQLERLKKAEARGGRPVAYWNPSVDLDQAAFSYANSPAFPVPLFRGAPPATNDDATSKDAARYRWIEPVFAGLFGITSMDEYIDRAMAKEQP